MNLSSIFQPLSPSRPTPKESHPAKAQELRQGCILVFEGIDGAGKTTQARKLYEHLQREGYYVVSLKEPTNGPWGQKISQLARHGRQGVSPSTELEWFLQDRRENVAQNIQPALERRQVVLLDRYYFSTMAYQGALGYDTKVIQARNEAFAPVPDLVFLLEIAPNQALQRVQQRCQPNSFEQQDYLETVAKFFSQMHFPYMRRIDATLAPEVIHARIWQEVQAVLARFENA